MRKALDSKTEHTSHIASQRASGRNSRARVYSTMAGFEDSRPKTKAPNLASAGAILFQFQKFQNLVHYPPLFEPWKRECLEKE